jgi:prephenate dehydrogenase
MTQRKYLIVGCGLIGGSIARKLRVIDQDCIIDYFDCNKITAGFLTRYDHRTNHIYDVVFMTSKEAFNLLPIEHNKHMVLINLLSFQKNAYAPLFDTPREMRQVGVHFMAGSEESGFKNSSATLFDGCNFSVIQYENDETHEEILSEIEPLIKQIANSSEQILSVSPEEHNINVAHTSHLLHFLDLKVPPFNKLSSFKRISQSNKEMWEEIFKKNEKNIMDALGHFISRLRASRDTKMPTFAHAQAIHEICQNIPKNFKGSAYYEVVGNLDEKN